MEVLGSWDPTQMSLLVKSTGNLGETCDHKIVLVAGTDGEYPSPAQPALPDEIRSRVGFILPEALAVYGLGFQLFRVSAGGVILYQGFCH